MTQGEATGVDDTVLAIADVDNGWGPLLVAGGDFTWTDLGFAWAAPRTIRCWWVRAAWRRRFRRSHRRRAAG